MISRIPGRGEGTAFPTFPIEELLKSLQGRIEHRRFRSRDLVSCGEVSFKIPAFPVVVGNDKRLFGTSVCIGRKEGVNSNYRGPLEVNFLNPAIIDVLIQRARNLHLPVNCLCLDGVMSLQWDKDKPKIDMHDLVAGSHPQPIIFVSEVISYTPDYKSFIIQSGGTSCFGLELHRKEPFKLGRDIEGKELMFNGLEDFIATLPLKTIYFDRGTHRQPLLPHRVFGSKPALLEFFSNQLRAPFNESPI